jgi:hypothetical protein
MFGDHHKTLIADSVAILREHAPFWYPANMIYLLATKRGRQILSLFCVITLIWLILLYSSIADVVAIMRQNAPFVDLVKSSIADFVAILRDHAHFCDFPLHSGNTCCRYFVISK